VNQKSTSTTEYLLAARYFYILPFISWFLQVSFNAFFTAASPGSPWEKTVGMDMLMAENPNFQVMKPHEITMFSVSWVMV